MPSDAAIWDRFLIAHPTFFDAVSYDIRVGKGVQPDNEDDPVILEMSVLLTQRRIDVLAERNNRLWLVEIKQDPGVSIIGQLLGYQLLMQETDPLLPSLQLCAVVNRTFPDLNKILEKYKVLTYIV